MREEALSPRPLAPDYCDHLSGEHEQVTDIVDSIRRERGAIFSANLPNTGQVPNLPPDAIVEGPAVAGGGGLPRIPPKPLPAALAGTPGPRGRWAAARAR